jgi:amino acid transporter
MLSGILFLIGSILMATCIIMVGNGNNNGWSFFLPAFIILMAGGLFYDLSHRKPRRGSVEDGERPIRRKKRRTASY